MSSAVSSILGSVLGTVVSSIFAKKGGRGEEPAAPTQSKPTVMPTPDDQAVQQAKRRQIASDVARRGRASTILTESASSEKLGG